MSEAGKYFRLTERGYAHWCPACEEIHLAPHNGWTFNNDLDFPTFTPSLKHTGIQTINKDGRWTGEWVLDQNKKPIPMCCHYFIKNGVIQYQNDCTHDFKNKHVALMPIPYSDLKEGMDY